MALRSAWKVVKSAELKKLSGHSKMKEWSVYIIRCRDRALYTGISTMCRGDSVNLFRAAGRQRNTRSFSLQPNRPTKSPLAKEAWRQRSSIGLSIYPGRRRSSLFRDVGAEMNSSRSLNWIKIPILRCLMSRPITFFCHLLLKNVSGK